MANQESKIKQRFIQRFEALDFVKRIGSIDEYTTLISYTSNYDEKLKGTLVALMCSECGPCIRFIRDLGEEKNNSGKIIVEIGIQLAYSLDDGLVQDIRKYSLRPNESSRSVPMFIAYDRYGERIGFDTGYRDDYSLVQKINQWYS